MARKTCDLTTPINVPNIVGWGAEPLSPADEDNGTWKLQVTFFGVANRVWSSHNITVANGMSTKLSRNGSPTSYQDLIVSGEVATPTGCSTLMDAVRSANNTPAARRKAMTDSLLALGVLDASLTGTT